jgi:hypothetical protein
MNAALALQQAVFARLVASEAIKDIVDDPPRVFDTVPRGATFPYIVIGEDRQSDWSTATETASEHRLVIHVWSRSPGAKEARVAAQAVADALDGAALAVPGFTLVNLRWLDGETLRENDGETIHAQLTFRAVLENE